MAMTMMAKTLEKLMETPTEPSSTTTDPQRIATLEGDVQELKSSVAALLSHFGVTK
jgi:hypothetical protein